MRGLILNIEMIFHYLFYQQSYKLVHNIDTSQRPRVAQFPTKRTIFGLRLLANYKNIDWILHCK